MPDWLGAHPEALPAIQAALASSRRRATPPAPTTRSTRSAGSTPTAARASCATAGSPRRASRRCRPRTPRSAAATTSRRRSSRAARAPSGCGGRRRRGGPVDDPTRGVARRARAVEVGRLVLDRPGLEREQRRRHPGLRPHAGDRRHRAVGRRDPAFPQRRVPRFGGAPGVSSRRRTRTSVQGVATEMTVCVTTGCHPPTMAGVVPLLLELSAGARWLA